MRVCFVLPRDESFTHERGGAIATVTHQVARQLTSRGHDTWVAAVEDGLTPFDDAGIVLNLPQPSVWRSRFDALVGRLVGGGGAEVMNHWRGVTRSLSTLHLLDTLVVANDVALAAGLAREFPDTRVVLWIHNLITRDEAPKLVNLDESITLVVVSEAVADWTSIEHSIPRGRITVILNGVDVNSFRPRDNFADPVDMLHVVCHGRIDPNKGFDIAADAVAHLRNEGINIALTVIGDVKTFGMRDSDVNEYVDHIERRMALAGADRVPHVPHSDIPELLRHFDVACVLPRSEEPFGLVCLEAMSSGCALIASRSGGIPEVVGDSAIVVEREDVDAVIAALRRFATDPEKLAEYKKRGVTRASEFTWSRTADEFVALMDGPGT